MDRKKIIILVSSVVVFLLLVISFILIFATGKEIEPEDNNEVEVVETIDVKAEAEERFEYQKESLLATASKEIKELSGVIKDTDDELDSVDNDEGKVKEEKPKEEKSKEEIDYSNFFGDNS